MIYRPLLSLVMVALAASTGIAQSTVRVSVDSMGAQSSKNGKRSSLSADGRIVAFESEADDLVAGDTNGLMDVFVHDTLTGSTTRVSVDSAGQQSDGASTGAALSADGRHVAFQSEAANLVVGDTNGARDVFVHDRQTGQTMRVSVDAFGTQANSDSEDPAISADGRYVAFVSEADNLVAGDVNLQGDVFLYDLLTGQCALVSKTSSGTQADGRSYDAELSADGQIIAFRSDAANLVVGDLNGFDDVFVHEFLTGVTTRVSLTELGAEANHGSFDAKISADGRFVAFASDADNIVAGDANGAPDVFWHDLQTGTIVRISVDSQGAEVANGGSWPALSADGRYVAFHSDSNQLVSPDLNGLYDVFLHDRLSGSVTLISVTPAGAAGERKAIEPSISADGRRISFSSSSADLVPADTNRVGDVFLRDLDYAGPALVRGGSCPGAMDLTITAAIPAGRVALLSGSAGSFVQSGPPCQGLMLSISTPTLRRLDYADGRGVVLMSAHVPAGFCGLTVQAVDLTTCTASNAVIL